MDIGTLKKLRAIVPGTLIMLGALPMYTYVTDEPLSSIQALDWLLAGAAAVVAYVLGAIYNVYCLRAMFNRNSHARITANIKHRLLAMGRTMPLTDARREELLRGNDLMDVFYALIDSRESLKERAKLVRDNGLVWSSIADVVVLGVVFASLYIPLWLIVDYAPFKIWGFASGALTLLAGFLFHPQAERRHIQLSNEQLNFIATQMKGEVETKVNAL